MRARLIVQLAIAIAACGQERDPQQALAHAIQLHQAGRIEEAITAYRAFLKLEPEHVEARSNLGAALSHTGRYEEAIAEYEQALKRAPSNAGIRLNLALAYYKSAQLARAVSELIRVHEARPDDRQPALLLADCYLQMGENRKVVDLLTPLEPQNTDNRAFSYLLGTALIRDSQVARGQALVDRILRDGETAEARLLLGTAEFMARDFTKARKDLARAAELNPRLPSVHGFYGRALLATGDPANAQAEFRKELELNPFDFDSNLNLGFLLRQDQKHDEAMPFIERALKVRPRAAAARYQLATVYLAKGQTAEAQRELEQVVADEPGFVEAHVSLATLYYRLKRKSDGDREREIVRKLNAERQAQQPGARTSAMPAPAPNSQ